MSQSVEETIEFMDLETQLMQCEVKLNQTTVELQASHNDFLDTVKTTLTDFRAYTEYNGHSYIVSKVCNSRHISAGPWENTG